MPPPINQDMFVPMVKCPIASTFRHDAPAIDVAALLRAAGVRPTRQRQQLARLLFDGCDKHVTAEQMHAATKQQNMPMALATVYNNLHQFTAAGLLRQVTVDAGCVYFDTHTGAHHHFYDSQTGQLIDVSSSEVKVEQLPPPPEGRAIAQVDIIIRLR